MKPTCIFCQIVAGTAEARIEYQDDLITAFWDQRPMAPVHILLVPNVHLESVDETGPEHQAMLGRMITTAAKLAADHGVKHSGYRLVINTGPDAGQTIFHLHLHLIGGRHLPFRFE